MEVRKPAKFLLIIAILFYLLSAVMLYKGYDKMTNYSNPEYSFMTTHNAYVGGDAYNSTATMPPVFSFFPAPF